MLMIGKKGIVDSSYQLGMGYLDFIPHPKESYTVRITTPAKIENVPDPFKKLGMRSEGVVIQIADLCDEQMPKAVSSQGEPIRLTLRQQGPARKLLLAAQCRGQIVDQRWVEIKREPVDVTLLPTQEATGMVRVTAYEPQGKTLQPLAERLVYRRAAQRLELGFNLNQQQLSPGPVTAKATARDEKGQPAAAWVLASVIDERFQAPPRACPPTSFCSTKSAREPTWTMPNSSCTIRPNQSRCSNAFSAPTVGAASWASRSPPSQS